MSPFVTPSVSSPLNGSHGIDSSSSRIWKLTQRWERYRPYQEVVKPYLSQLNLDLWRTNECLRDRQYRKDGVDQRTVVGYRHRNDGKTDTRRRTGSRVDRSNKVYESEEGIDEVDGIGSTIWSLRIRTYVRS